MLIFYYIIGIGCSVGIYFLFRKSTSQRKEIVIYALDALCWVAFWVNAIYFVSIGDHWLTVLPLHLCNFGVILIPIAVYFKKKTLYDFIFYVCSLGAIFALLTPNVQYIGEPFGMIANMFYIFHFIIAVAPFWLIGWGMYRPRLTLKSLAAFTGILLSVGLIMHIFNMIANGAFNIPANYFFTLRELSAWSNPLLAIFAGIIPLDYFYLYLTLPILWIYAPRISLPWQWREWKEMAIIKKLRFKK